jgi:multiple sugar transport system substrate-binding protein
MNSEATTNAPLAKALEAFTKKTGIKVEVQPTPQGDAYDAKIRTALAGGAAPDIMRVNDDYIRQFSNGPGLLDLAPYIKKDNIDTSQFAQEPYKFADQPDGRHTAWIVGYQARLIYYNKNMFKEAGVPLPPTTWTSENWDWDAFLERAKKLTVDGKQWGALVRYDKGYEQTFAINNGHDSGVYNKAGTAFTLADPKATEGLQWAADLTCKHKVQPDWSLLKQNNIHTQMFAQGKIGMLFAPFSVAAYLKDTIKDFDWDVAAPPANVEQKTLGSVVPFTVPASAKNPDGAWELLKFLSSEEGGKILAEGRAFMPINNAAAATVKSNGEAPEHLGLFAEASKHLTAENQTANTLGARGRYRPALDAAYSCQRPVSDILTEVKPEVDTLLAPK